MNEIEYRVGKYGDWGGGGSKTNDFDQAPGYPVMRNMCAIAWFIYRADAEAFVHLLQKGQPGK